MKRRRRAVHDPTQTGSQSDLADLKHPKPKVLCLDIDDEAVERLQGAGYNVANGSFGSPYKVEKTSRLLPIIDYPDLPNVDEQEIVVIGLSVRSIANTVPGEPHVPAGEEDLWTTGKFGVVDPRPKVMMRTQETLDRILSHGGIFIIFAAPRVSQNVVLASERRSGLHHSGREWTWDTWGFLSILDHVTTNADVGNEISAQDGDHEVVRLLARQLAGSKFLCSIRPSGYIAPRWAQLAVNKYGDDVAAAFAPPGDDQGWVLILPQLHDKGEFLVQLFESVLPELSPALFPHAEGLSWVHRKEYELPQILRYRQQIEEIESDTQIRVEAIEEQIEAEQAAGEYLYALLRESGHPLVGAVAQALATLGFEHALDVDAERRAAGITGPDVEDVQLKDRSPLLLVEVKGISGTPSDEDALQVAKYIAPRMRELGRTDIQGLSVVNHQRHLPPLERVTKPFRDDVITSATQQGVALISAWDLFRLVRGCLAYGWPAECTLGLFYRAGLIEPIPLHYRYLGTVIHFWDEIRVVGLRIESEGLRLGDRIAFELPVDFHEQEVSSLHLGGQPADAVQPITEVGIATDLPRGQAKKGTRVYRIIDQLTSI